MKIHGKLMLTIIALIWMLAASAFAQGPPRRPPGGGPPGGGPPPGWERGSDQGRRPDGGRPPRGGAPGFSLLSSEMRFDSKVVKGAAYSAQAITESTQILGDGTRITRKAASAIYRDSEGRTRRELTLDSLGPFEATGEAQQLIFINDPATGAHYVLYPQHRTARKMKMSANQPPPPPEQSFSTEGKTESLGKKTIEGVEAEGTRSTITIAAGQIGNDRPIVIVSERWYSPILQAVVLSKHHDPRVGENVYHLTNIARAEPAKSLFELPADYKVEETSFPSRRPPQGGRRKPHRF